MVNKQYNLKVRKIYIASQVELMKEQVVKLQVENNQLKLLLADKVLARTLNQTYQQQTQQTYAQVVATHNQTYPHLQPLLIESSKPTYPAKLTNVEVANVRRRR